MTKAQEKELRGQLAGTRIRVRKRNIQIPLDPQSFADSIETLFNDGLNENTQGSLEKDLAELANVMGDSSSLEFDRYGNTFFELIFTGGRMGTGTSGEPQLARFLLQEEATHEATLPWVTFMQACIRRRPFLVRNLEEVLEQVVKQLTFFPEEDQKKVAIAAAQIFQMALGPLPVPMFRALQDDSKVESGVSLRFSTEFFKAFLAIGTMEELVTLLRRAKMEESVTDFFPINRRSEEHFTQHFTEAGIPQMVEHSRKTFADAKLKEVAKEIKMALGDGNGVTEMAEAINTVTTGLSVPEDRLVGVIWNSVMDNGDWSTKNQQQSHLNALKHVQTWAPLLEQYATSAKLELALLNAIQVFCYEDAKVLKLFPQIVKVLYDMDVLDEDTIMFWYRKGSSQKGRHVFVADMEPLIKWLQEAEEDEEDSDSD